MKFNKYIGIAIMPMLFAACQNEVMDESMQLQDQPIYTLSGKMNKGVDSRAQIQLGNPNASGEIFMWNEGDCFNLYQGGAESEVTFNISSDYNESVAGDKSSATFTSNVPVYPGSYVAVYPTVPIENDGFIFNLQRSLDFSNAVTQEEKDAVWKEYFKKNMFMIARGTLTIEGTNAIQFEHQSALARITYHNESGSAQVLNNVRLSGQNQSWSNWARKNIDGSGGGNNITDNYNLNLNGLQVAAGESTDIYMFFFPTELNEDGIVEIYFSVNGSERKVSLPATEIAAANGGSERFQEGMRYWFNVTATRNGAMFTKNYSTAPITFENVAFAAALQEVLGEDIITIDPNTGFGTMIEADVMSVTNLDFGCGEFQIPSLDGIEKFKNLESLSCNQASVEDCNLEQNMALREIELYNNQLVSLDLSGCPNLKNLYLSNNQNLTSLNISNCMRIERLEVNETALSTLDIPKKDFIYSLGYGRTKLSFNLNEFPKLTNLAIYDLELTSLDLIPSNIKAQLYQLQCYDNQISSINLSEYPKMAYLSIYQNNFTSLDLTPVPGLKELNCHTCYIKELDITPVESLEYLYCGIQRNNINLILTATDAQKDRWRNDWSKSENTWGLNDRAYLKGEEPATIPEGSGTGSDFSGGGVF